ncbi:hypothetical protein HPP92_028187 [Vanilla planifolia]|uniref:Calcineurin-like phosphoesterase domain-containing protein n=1 Tax=Vanilla planifolia TaxID=51239 RepID=A0A835PBZ3_VANPL|nr:hypothetical protein HPP92_028187 [Vanilla planifolia]
MAFPPSGLSSTAAMANLIVFLICLSSRTSNNLAFYFEGVSVAEAETVSREVFPMDGDLAWIVQISDLHISAYHPERADDLVRLLAPALRVVRPALLLVTGDITDAKNRRRTSSRQDESEWIQYKNSMDAVVKHSGIEKRRIFDIQGNHDKYGVPFVGSSLDFFSTHSISSQFNRLGTIQSISLEGGDRKYLFLGIDDTMSVGIRGPSNLFGHPTDERIAAAVTELETLDEHLKSSVTKLVFGHFPMSFTASSAQGERYETAFAKQSISAYICGHLHATFGKQLWRLHTVSFPSDSMKPKRATQFWEWELGDWKDYRFIRILAIDQGEVSFLDLELNPSEKFQSSMLITYPTDSRINNRAGDHDKHLRNDINVLVFSVQEMVNVTAKIFDSRRDFCLVEEITMQPAPNYSINKPLFHAKWNAENYRSVSAHRYWLQVFAFDSEGEMITSIRRPFSVEGRAAHFSPTWLAYLIFYLQWENIYSILLWSNICFLVLLLSLPKLLTHLMKRNASYQNWAASTEGRNLLFNVFWFLIEGSRNTKLWAAMVTFLLYLLMFPWFWGRATSEDGEISEMYLSGWRMEASTDGGTLGVPDLMTITLPFMYFVVTPLFLAVYGLSAEMSAICLRLSRTTERSDLQAHLVSGQNGAHLGWHAEKTRSLVCKRLRGWSWALLLICAVIVCSHSKLASGTMSAYGTRPVALSPAVSLVPLLLLVAAVYSMMTKSLRP